MIIPGNLLYTKEHEWVLLEGGRAKVGITDYAQGHLGDVTYIELPKKGKDVRQFEAMASVESVKAASEIYAAMSGKVLEVNDKLASAPELLNKSPYEEGWIAALEIRNASEKNNLMDAASYKKYVEALDK